MINKLEKILAEYDPLDVCKSLYIYGMYGTKKLWEMSNNGELKMDISFVLTKKAPSKDDILLILKHMVKNYSVMHMLSQFIVDFNKIDNNMISFRWIDKCHTFKFPKYIKISIESAIYNTEVKHKISVNYMTTLNLSLTKMAEPFIIIDTSKLTEYEKKTLIREIVNVGGIN